MCQCGDGNGQCSRDPRPGFVSELGAVAGAVILDLESCDPRSPLCVIADTVRSRDLM